MIASLTLAAAVATAQPRAAAAPVHPKALLSGRALWTVVGGRIVYEGKGVAVP